MKLLIIEDEVKVNSFLKQGFEEELFTVDQAFDGEQGLFLALTETYDAIILDLMLPRRSGLEVLKEIRREKDTPILILTAKGDTDDKVKGLNEGADDYLTKPFALAECIARIRSLVRRSQTDKSVALLKAGDLEMDTLQHSVRRGNRAIDLTAKEFKLVEYLLRNKNNVLTRSSIIEHIWEVTFDSETNVLDVYMTRIRKKIDEGEDIKLIHTVRGVGYSIKEPEQ
ncbi:MAG: response regulator transcription factor [Chlorobi bacterium]|nr:response regulator transcription factor [Chlorobiota bacterium]